MENQIVNEARNRFDPELHTEVYKNVHSDDSQLDSLIRLFEIKEKGRYFDLGTGNGYVGLELAKRYKNCSFIGVDIAIDSIAKNNHTARNDKIKNIEFLSYSGINLPFGNQHFDGGISRYALHHFPDIDRSIGEISRITNIDGFFILSDPKTYDIDTGDFVDRFQKLIPDGHVHFYREGEIDSIFEKHGFVKETSFKSSITYSRGFDIDYESLIEKEGNEVLDVYKIRIKENHVFITVECMNSLYRKANGAMA